MATSAVQPSSCLAVRAIHTASKSTSASPPSTVCWSRSAPRALTRNTSALRPSPTPSIEMPKKPSVVSSKSRRRSRTRRSPPESWHTTPKYRSRSSNTTRTSVRSVAGRPSTGSTCVNAVIGRTRCQSGSSSRPSTSITDVAGTAEITGMRSAGSMGCAAAVVRKRSEPDISQTVQRTTAGGASLTARPPVRRLLGQALPVEDMRWSYAGFAQSSLAS